MGLRSNELIQIKAKEKGEELSILDHLKIAYEKFAAIDPRYVVLFILMSYLVLGFTILGFNRTPTQAIITTLSTMAFEVGLSWLFTRRIFFPLSALITSCSLTILLNYSHDFFVLFIPIYFAIGSKYMFTFNGRHAFNPAQLAVTGSLLFAGDLVTAAPSYQWNGIESMGIFIAMLGIFFLLPRINRTKLVVSFLVFFTLQILLRSWIMRHHLPFETLFLGTVTSPAFFLFTFFMITDPATSPREGKDQVKAGFWLAFLDLIYHIKQSYFTFFYAGSTLQGFKLIKNHVVAAKNYEAGISGYLNDKFIKSGYYIRMFTLVGLFVGGQVVYKEIIHPRTPINNLDFKFVEISPKMSGVAPVMGKTLERVDPRVQHLAKWIISVGDSVASGDFDGDGLVDLFYTFPLKNDSHRNSLYKNLGNFKFERIDIPAISLRSKEIEKYGLPSNAMFVDYDNDHDLDLLITYAFGSPVLLQNQLKETGSAGFLDVSEKVGINNYHNTISANFIDINSDGRLDLILGNVWPEYFEGYSTEDPKRINLFDLPEAEYEGDERMFNFMHASWHKSNNGGLNSVYMQKADGSFESLDSREMGMPETRWSLAIATADFNKDGMTDLYVANDFGKDDMYLNLGNNKFKAIRGEIFGSIGMDTYKGMNATTADVDNDGYQDVYVSNVHHAMQAEGSLLWSIKPDEKSKHGLAIVDKATEWGALNPTRFGWGAAMVDFNNDGRIDIAQANGMVDDLIDKKYDECPDYWYTNEKIARSAPSYHRLANKWGDIRGYCIYGKERNRLYLNNGKESGLRYTDVAKQIGMDKLTNSRAMGAIDLDNDGRLDLVVTHQFHEPTIYKNTLERDESYSFVGIELESFNPTCNSKGIGSSAELTYQDDKGNLKTVYREAKVVNGFSAQSDMRLHFGLGKNAKIVDLTVNWCQKQKVKYTNLKINKYQKLQLLGVGYGQ